jgi:hypothetical protein
VTTCTDCDGHGHEPDVDDDHRPCLRTCRTCGGSGVDPMTATRGRWHHYENEVRNSGGDKIGTFDRCRPEFEQNARIAAAGPDMLDALRACLAVMPVNWREDGEIAAARRAALLAIERATVRP